MSFQIWAPPPIFTQSHFSDILFHYYGPINIPFAIPGASKTLDLFSVLLLAQSFPYS